MIRGVVYWPLVGVITGIIDCAVFVILSFFLPKSVAVAGGILCQLLVTGRFHLDGLCDTADALFSARSRERMLEIMKDSRVGTNGVIAAIFDIGLKVMILSRLAHPVMAFLLTPVAGKCVQGVLMYKAVYPRKKRPWRFLYREDRMAGDGRMPFLRRSYYRVWPFFGGA